MVCCLGAASGRSREDNDEVVEDLLLRRPSVGSNMGDADIELLLDELELATSVVICVSSSALRK